MIKPDMNLVEMSNCIVPQCRSGELGRNSVFRPALQLRANPKILMISNERERERERENTEAWLRIQKPSPRRQSDKFQLSRFQTDHLFSRSSRLYPTWRSIEANGTLERDKYTDESFAQTMLGENLCVLSSR